MLKQIIDKKLKELYQEHVEEEIKKRIEEELNMIEKSKTEYQYLLAYKISEKARMDNRIMIDRICGSSYIAYLLGITFVDPIKYYITYKKEFNPITFDLEFSSDYLKEIFDYTKEICKEENIIINEIDDLKKHNIYLNTFNIAHLLEELEEKTNKKRENIDLNDNMIYQYLTDKNTTLLESFEMEVLENFQTKYHQNINNILILASIISISHSTITDKLNIINIIMDYPIYRENIYDCLTTYGIENYLSSEIMYFISKGKHHLEKKKEKWNYYVSIMKKQGIEDDYINYCANIHYLYPKSYCVNRAIIYVWLTYYKIYYPEIYKKVK